MHSSPSDVPTAGLRAGPDFMLIGRSEVVRARCSGISRQHPSIRRGLRKEVRYFSQNYERGESWYRAHFPTHVALRLGRPIAAKRLVFEATPDYLFHPFVPERAHCALPDAKLIVLLREPVDRTWSHYQHEVRLGFEDLDFERALAAEPQRLAGGIERLQVDPNFERRLFLRFSYVARGRYAEQIERWIALYPKSGYPCRLRRGSLRATIGCSWGDL